MTEIWFCIISNRALPEASFTSLRQLRNSIAAAIFQSLLLRVDRAFVGFSSQPAQTTFRTIVILIF